MIKGRPSQEAGVPLASLPPPKEILLRSAEWARLRAYPSLRWPSRIFGRYAARTERASVTLEVQFAPAIFQISRSKSIDYLRGMREL